MSELLTLAVPKGRLLGEAVKLLRKAGIDARALERSSRRLAVDLPKAGIRAILLRASDVPTYVEHGIADLGIAGRDVLEETEADLYEPLDLGIGRCRLVLAEPVDFDAKGADNRSQLRIATKYPNVTRRYLEATWTVAEIIRLSGSVEIGATSGLADRIVDLVETGSTLKANGLREVETILTVSSRLVINRASFKIRRAELKRLVDRIARISRTARAA